MTGEDAFFQAMRAAPDDVALRLVYADWLDERGQADRAEYIRTECALPGLPGAGERRWALEARARLLWNRHRAAWEGPLRRLCREWRFRLGLLDWACVTAQKFLDHAEELFRLGPLWSVRFTWAGPRASGLAACPALGRLTAVDLAYNYLNDAGATALAGSPHLAGVRQLWLGHNFLRDEGAICLAESAHLDNLTLLDLAGNRVGEAGRLALRQRFGERVRL